MPSLLDMDAFMKGQSDQTNTLGTNPSSFNGDIHGLIDEVSLTEGVDPELVRALVKLESGFNPNAKNPDSSASGLMQLVKGTADEMGVQDVFDPKQNLTGGVRYLKKHLDSTGGDVEKALAMYNQGPAGDLSKAQGYVDKIKEFYGKDFTSPSTPDLSSLISQYGVDPYPKSEPLKLNIPTIPSIVPEIADDGSKFRDTAVGRGFTQALNSPQPEVGKLPFGIENKGGTVSKWAKDVLYGLPEGVMTLGAGLVGLPAAAIGGTAKAVTSGLEAGGDTFNEIAHTAMGTPQTATAQYMMKPFEVIFGGILNSGAEVVKDLNPTATPEELASKVKATQFVMNLAMVAPMFKGAVKGRGKVDAENPAKSLDDHEVTPEVVEEAKAQVMADPSVAPEVKAQVGGIDVGVLQSIQKKAATSVAKDRVQKAGVPEAKFPENQSIVEGLLTEVELREGRAKTAMRKAAQIVAQHEGDIALTDLSGIKGINVKGSTGKAIAKLIEERNALKKGEEKIAQGTGDDVPMGDDTPVEPVKSLEDIPPKVEEATPEVSTAEPVSKVDFQSLAESIDPSLKYDGKMEGIPEAGIPDIHNLTLTLEDGRQPSFSISGEITPEKIAEWVKKIREKFESKVEEPPMEPTVGEVKGEDTITNSYKRPLETLHFSREPFEFGKIPEYAEESDSVFGDGFYAMLPDSEKYWSGMDRWSLGDYRNKITVEPRNPLVVTPETAVKILDQLNISERDRNNLGGQVKLGDYARDNGYDSIIVDGFYNPDIVDMSKKVISKEGEILDSLRAGFNIKYNPDTGKSSGDFQGWHKEANKLLDAWAKETYGANFDVVKTMSELQDQIFVINKNSDIIKPISIAKDVNVISEFDSISKAKDEGYTFPDKDRYQSPERAQAKADELGDGYEVVKVKGKYKVAKFEETSPIVEFTDEGAVNMAGLELMSEIPADKVKFESPTVEEGFGLAKVGDKYYRTSPLVDMPERGAKIGKSQREPIVDGVSASDWEALKAFTDEATLKELRAKDTLKELANTAKLEEVKSPETSAALAQAFVEWRDSYVTKCNVAKPSKKSKPVTKESLATFDDNFKTFKSMEDAKEWVEATGAVGELIPDPLTGKVSFMNTEKLKGLEEMDLWDEGVEQLTGRRESRLEDWDNPEMEMSETGVRDLFSIFNNERGSVDVTPLYGAVDAINKVVADAKKMGKSIDDYLAHIGADEVAIAAFKAAMARVPQMKERLKEQDPVTSAILMPEGKVVAQTVNRNKNKEVKSVGPPITEELANRAMSADRSMQWGTDVMRVDPETGKIRVEHTTNAFEKAMQATEVKINSFRAAGLSEIYSQWREAKSAAEHEKSQVKEWLDGLESQIAPERREAFALAAYGDMKSVKEALGTMGITEIPQLTLKESMVLEQLFDYTRKFRDRANYIRTHTGQKAIPQLKDMSGRENYLPLMRDLNVLRDMGLTEGLTISDSKKLGELSKKFNGMFNPNAKKRNVSDIPIELDPFKALRRHADYGIAEIHISPVAALAKDLANLKLPRPDGVKGKISLVDWNPNLSRMLSRWSDQIVGKDVVATAMANANPFFAWFKDRLSKNLVVATIGGSLRTVLVQPTSYIIGIPTMLDMRSAGYGIAKLMSERPFGKSNARQNSSVLAIREADYAFKELSDYIQQGKMSGTVGYLAEKSLAPMKWVDSVMAEAGWNAARYYGEKRLKLQGKELYRFADDVVERTQGLGIKGAVSDVQSSAATKWLTLLQTFAIADFNLIARDVLGIKNPEASQGKTIIRVAKYTAATILAGQMYKMMGLDNVVPDPIGAYEEAKKDGKGDLRAVGAAAGELLEKVPLIGGSAKYSSSLFGIAGEWGSILPEAGEKFAASLDWKKLTPKQRAYNIKLIARAVGMTAGVPMTNQILKSINAYSKGGNPYQVILGVYEVEKKKKGGLRPEVPRPPRPARPF